MQVRKEIIKVKDSADYSFNVLSTNHGPVCNNAMKDFSDISSEPISVCWTLLKFPTNLFQVSYALNHSKGIADVRKAASQIIAPGLNVVYGDAEGNIAWWAAAKLVKRPAHVNSRLLLDGSSGKDDWEGWYDFSFNPQSENPESGFVYSANNQPDSSAGILYPGYYTPEDRAKRIIATLSENKKFDLSDMQKLNSDVTSSVAYSVAKTVMNVLSDAEKNKSTNHRKAFEMLNAWSGTHNLTDVAPVIYYKLQYCILKNAMADELGEKDLGVFILTHVEKNSFAVLFQNDSSVWWDDVSTKNITETRKNIFEKSFDETITELENQLGKNMDEWQWQKVHTLEHVHPIGRQKPFDKFFNVGPFSIAGGNETVNSQGFDINATGVYKVRYGPAVRRVIDFANPLNAQSVIPTGQSGNAMSKHYEDQAQLYLNHQTRKEMMDKNEIEKVCRDKLVLQPQ
jgi:penicillin amidase